MGNETDDRKSGDLHQSPLSRIKNLESVPEGKRGALRVPRKVSFKWWREYLRLQTKARRKIMGIPLEFL